MKTLSKHFRSPSLVYNGAFQLCLIATGFAAWRALQAPSTFTFFVFEAAFAATLGIFLYLRLGAKADALSARRGKSLASGGSADEHGIVRRSGDVKQEDEREDGPESTTPQDNSPNARSSRRMFLLLSTAFFVFLSAGILTLSTALYTAPAGFYVVLGAAAGVLAGNIYRCGHRFSLGILVQITLLAALAKFYFFLLNPYVYTSDSFLQFSGLLALSTSGSVPEQLGHYFYFPGSAIFAYAGVTVGGIPPVWFGMFPLLAQLALVPAVYLVGCEIADRSVGLFASLLTVFSVFGFLSTQYTPALYGLPSLVLAIYVVTKISSQREFAWLIAFWIAALGAFFSHPVSALVLALVLIVRLASFRFFFGTDPRRRAPTTPALSYSVVYAAYLAFIAATSFEVFVHSIFTTTYSPSLTTTPTSTLSTTSTYVLQTAIAPIGLVFVIFFAGYGLFATSGLSRAEHRFFTLLVVAFAIIPAVEVVAQNFRTQSSRFLLYISIPLALMGGHGLTRISGMLPRLRRSVVLVASLFAVFGLLASASYLTNNDNRFLGPDVPALTTHITTSALASRDFIALAEQGSSVYMDFGSSTYFENSDRARNALVGLRTDTIDGLNGETGHAFVLVNNHFLPYGNPYLGTLYDVPAIQRLLQDANAARLFDAGEVQVYLTP